MMAKAPKKAAEKVVAAVGTVAVSPKPEAPKFTPCRQCGYPADCERRAKCRKGFK